MVQRRATCAALIRASEGRLGRLELAVKYGSWRLSEAAIHALGSLGDARAIPILRRVVVSHQRDWTIAAASALDALGWTPTTPRERAEAATARADWKSAAGEGPDGVVTIMASGQKRDYGGGWRRGGCSNGGQGGGPLGAPYRVGRFADGARGCIRTRQSRHRDCCSGNREDRRPGCSGRYALAVAHCRMGKKPGAQFGRIQRLAGDGRGS